MENSKSKLPSGITIDLNASPTTKSFSSSPSVESINTTLLNHPIHFLAKVNILE